MSVSSVVVFLVALGLYSLGGFVFKIDRAWYDRLAKPVWTPKSRTIALVWMILYVLIAIAIASLSEKPGFSELSSIVWFWLVVNWLSNQSFSYFMFQRKSLSGAFLASFLTAVTAFFLVVSLTDVNKAASWLLFPYLVWTCFATFLAWLIYLLNRR